MVEEDRVCREQGPERCHWGLWWFSEITESREGSPGAEGSGRMKNLAQRPSGHLVHSMVEGHRQ